MPILLLLAVIVIIYLLYKNKRKEEVIEAVDTKSYTYAKKCLMTEMEKKFFAAIKKSAGENYTVQPQVKLATIIEKQGDFKYQNELYRNIDFGIFDENYNIVLLIEINDETHNEPNRKKRDAKVRDISKIAGIPLITFYTKYGVNQKYIDEKIHEII
jgi:hypothetical protein